MIKNIIFDFGDIFIDLDKPATVKEMYRFGLTEVTAEMDQINHNYERGKVSSQEFVSFYKERFPMASDQQLIHAWNAIILDFPESRLEFIEELAKEGKYRLFLLSNTNELHIEKVKKNMTLERYQRFQNCFEKFYLSHEIHMRKPDAEIYQFVLDQNQLVAEQTLFVDDTKENTDAASALGIHSWNLIPGEDDVLELFNQKTIAF